MPPSSRGGTLAICAIARNEARYLLEWVASHLLAGVDHIRVYDNESIDGTGLILSALGRHYPVECVYWPTIEGRSPHYSALEDGYARLKGHFAFVAAIDLDEFLFSASGDSLADWLQGLDPGISAVGINQFVFGSSGEREFRPQLVLSRFRRRKPDADPEHHFIKSIVRPERIARVHVHRPELSGGRYVHSDLTELTETEGRRGRAERIAVGDIRLHHYMLKSAEEFAAKRDRGGATGRTLAQRLRRYGPQFFTGRDEAANQQIDETLASRADRVEELVAEMAGRIAGRVGGDRIRSYYDFLSAPLPPEVSVAVRPDGEPAPVGSRPRLYVHVGLHKTGTTSMQAYLAKHRDNLAAAGLYVPLTGVAPRFDGHHLLPWSIGRPNSEHLTGIDPDALWADLRSELDTCGCPCAIVSSEEFCSLRDKEVDRFGRLLDGYEIVPIVILRRPGDVLDGGFRTRIVSGEFGSLERLVGNGPRSYYDYFSMLMRWRRLPGVSEMMIGSYDDPSVGKDVVRTVLGWLGCEYAAPAGKQELRLNTGIPAALIELARWLRQSGVERTKVADWLESMSHLPFTRAQVGEPRLVSEETERRLDAGYSQQLHQIEDTPLLAPFVRGSLPRPDVRRLRSIHGPADALLELPSIISGKPEPERAGSWLPRRLMPELGREGPTECAGNLDRPAPNDGAIRLTGRGPVMFAGWSFHPDHPDCPWYLLLHPADATALTEQVAPIITGVRRPDVAAAFPNLPPSVTSRSGFHSTLDMKSLPRGSYELRIACAAAGGLVLAPCRIKLTVAVS